MRVRLPFQLMGHALTHLQVSQVVLLLALVACCFCLLQLRRLYRSKNKQRIKENNAARAKS